MPDEQYRLKKNAVTILQTENTKITLSSNLPFEYNGEGNGANKSESFEFTVSLSAKSVTIMLINQILIDEMRKSSEKSTLFRAIIQHLSNHQISHLYPR